ncbi:XRE family transcriptional regulator [Sphingomonas aracearum]|uniref:XRE family transcriptional regulator n=1 Tax=Sphingomonas aracearum TaxID=2283317 RepID=UPI001EEFCA6E|nr:XRE family transcriptional regulator [Sphingomonas aracearum]
MASAERMREPVCAAEADEGSCVGQKIGTGYIGLIQHALEVKQMRLRQLELRTRINRARLGRILHRDAAKRHAMTLVEFRTLLHALDIDPVQAIIAAELIQDPVIANDERFANLAVMLSTLLKGLPQRLVGALCEVDGMDGSEIRQEWGIYFQSAVVNRMVQEIGDIIERRSRMSKDADPFVFDR